MRTSCLQITLPHTVHAQVHHMVLHVAMQIATGDALGDSQCSLRLALHHHHGLRLATMDSGMMRCVRSQQPLVACIAPATTPVSSVP